VSRMIIKRLFDLYFSFYGLIILAPVFAVVSFLIILDSRGGVFYRQVRIGKNGKKYWLYKFRTMESNSDKKGFLTIGSEDSRITKVGYYLRMYKIDELPQLINVLIGDMSLVGPRPEVEKYVKLYSEYQQEVLKIKPGITDMSSITYFNESHILSKSENPESYYINILLPEKLKLNMQYLNNISLPTDLRLILKTLTRIAGR